MMINAVATFLLHIRRRRRSRFCLVAAVVIFAVLYGIGGTKYTSLRLTSLDVELQSLKTVTFNETLCNKHDKGCFWYSDNLFHLMCAILTDRPIQFHAVANRVPRMQRELFQHLNVKRCESAKEMPIGSKGSGWKDLQRNLETVTKNLQLIESKCSAEVSLNVTTLSVKRSASPSATPTGKCLHLARSFNRRLQNCSIALEQCDVIVFDDSLSFCPLWKAMQDYDTIVSPHGFQLTMPILAHAALNTTRQTFRSRPSLHVIEVRWPAYQDVTYEGMVSVFPSKMIHTLIHGHSPGGKLNDPNSNCHNITACRKAERQKDLYCSAAAQEQMIKAIGT